MAISPQTLKRVSLKKEEQIVRAAKEDISQFKVLYELYFQKIYRYCYYHCSDGVQAEDLCSDIFLKALEAFDRYEWQVVPFGAWLFRIAANRLKNWYRDHKRTADLEDLPESKIAQTEAGFADCEDEVTKELVTRLLQETPGSCKDVLSFRFYEELPYQQIAERLEKTVASCKMQVKRCLERLKQEVLEKAPELMKVAKETT